MSKQWWKSHHTPPYKEVTVGTHNTSEPLRLIRRFRTDRIVEIEAGSKSIMVGADALKLAVDTMADDTREGN